MKRAERIKAIVTMVGLDGHTTGGEVVARILRDAGIEVIYLGVNQTPDMIVNAAIQEDVDIIGISSHASNYALIEELLGLLRAKQADDIPVVCGGNIPRLQAERLKEKGVAAIFPPGSSSETIISFVTGHAKARASGAAAESVPV